MRTIPEAAGGQFGAFTRQQALTSGWSRSALEHAVRVGRLWRPRPGTFAEPIPEDLPAHERRRLRLLVLAAAAALVIPNSVLSHETALISHGLPTLSVPELPCLTVRPRYTGDTSGIHLHRARLWRADVTHSAAITTARAGRAVIDTAREGGFDAGVVAADAALHCRLTSYDELHRVLDNCAGWPGIRRAGRVAGAADGRAESVLESTSRLRIATMPLPEPDLQTIIREPDGRYVRRVDFYWDEYGLVGEADGRSKYRDRAEEPLYREKEQEDRMRDLGLEVARWGWSQAGQPRALEEKLLRAVARTRERRGPRRWIAERTPRLAPQ